MEPYPTYSVVIPIHDEQESLQELQRRLVDVFPPLDGEVEVLFVDDGSTDLSYPLMLELHGRDPRFKVIHLARNFGHQLAITAGIELARGRRGRRDGRRPPASTRAASGARRALA